MSAPEVAEKRVRAQPGAAAAPPLRFVIVRLAGRDYGVPAARVCGMMLMRSADLEGAPSRPLVRIDGRAVPVLQPHGLLGLETRPLHPAPACC